RYCDTPDLHSFPTRRSSDLILQGIAGHTRIRPHGHRAFENVVGAYQSAGAERFNSLIVAVPGTAAVTDDAQSAGGGLEYRLRGVDRKSTRLNSSHVAISYAV